MTRRLKFDGGGTSALRTFSISANSVSPRNSFSVVSISWRMMPGGEHVGARVERHAADLLGRHVAELALEDADLARELHQRLGDAEVEQLDVAVVRQPHVRRRDVAVDDVERAAVGVGERVREVQALGDPRRDEHRVRHRDALLRLLAAAQHLRQVAAADVLHRDVVAALVLADLDGLDDAAVLEHHRELALAVEHVDEARLARELRPHHLDREQPLAAGLAGCAR